MWKPQVTQSWVWQGKVGDHTGHSLLVKSGADRGKTNIQDRPRRGFSNHRAQETDGHPKGSAGRSVSILGLYCYVLGLRGTSMAGWLSPLLQKQQLESDPLTL